MARRPNRTCEVCAALYVRNYSGQRTCGRACGANFRAANLAIRYQESKVAKAPDLYVCTVCSVEFAGSRRRYCSNACYMEGQKRLNSAWARGHRPPRRERCPCGTQVQPPRVKCDPCVERSRLATKQRGRRRRRALMKGVISEAYTLAEIAERDRFRCGICRKRVAMTRAVPHPGAPTADHILPLAAGGDDTRANVQLAHFSCNYTKRDGVAGAGEQLALIG